jgi:Helix-turn-helix domain of resolvase
LTTVSGTANEYRPLIRERTGAGRVIAKANGVRLGRPRKLNTEQRALALRLLREGQSAGEVAKTLRVHGGDDLSAGGSRSGDHGLKCLFRSTAPQTPAPAGAFLMALKSFEGHQAHLMKHIRNRGYFKLFGRFLR